MTLHAIGKESPAYKGRTFNKMLSGGAAGRYRRTASRQHLWNGIPEIGIGSWYTSRACTVHAVVVAKDCRKGEKIFLPCCDLTAHADLHASATIAVYPFLQPRIPDGSPQKPGRRT